MVRLGISIILYIEQFRKLSVECILAAVEEIYNRQQLLFNGDAPYYFGKFMTGVNDFYK